MPLYRADTGTDVSRAALGHKVLIAPATEGRSVKVTGQISSVLPFAKNPLDRRRAVSSAFPRALRARGDTLIVRTGQLTAIAAAC